MGDAAQQRDLPQPGQRAHHPAQPPDRHVEEAAHYDGVEVAPGAPSQLLPGGSGAERSLVGAHGGHRLVGVGDGDDAAAVGDLLGSEPVRIAPAVPALVMLLYGAAPFAQPPDKGLDEPGALERVIAQRLPLRHVQLPGLVEDVGMHRQLADVMEQRRPAQPVPGSLVERELVGDEVGESTHAFGVAPCLAIVEAEAGGHGQHRGRRLGGLPVEGARFQPALQVGGAPRPASHGQPVRGPVGEHH